MRHFWDVPATSALRDQGTGCLAEIAGMLDRAGQGHRQRFRDDRGQAARINHGDLSPLTCDSSSEIFSVENLAVGVNLRRQLNGKDRW